MKKFECLDESNQNFDQIPCNSNGVPEGGFNKYFVANVYLTDKASDVLAKRNVSYIIMIK